MHNEKGKMIRRVSSSNFILDDFLDKQEELEQDSASIFAKGNDGASLSSFWQGVQRGLFVSEGRRGDGKAKSSRVVLNNIDEEEVRITTHNSFSFPLSNIYALICS